MTKTRTHHKVPSFNALERECEKMWKACVMLAAGYMCEYPGCGKTIDTNVIQIHHFFSRSHKSTRWWVPNGICLCAYHHRLGPMSAHNDPLFREVIEQLKPEGWLPLLIERRNMIVKYKSDFLLHNLLYLNETFNRLLEVKGVTKLHVKYQQKIKKSRVFEPQGNDTGCPDNTGLSELEDWKELQSIQPCYTRTHQRKIQRRLLDRRFLRGY